MLYVPSIVKKEIQYPAIGKGELFTITTAEKKSGTLRSVKRLITASDTRVPVGAPAHKNATSQKRTGAAAGASTDAPSATNPNGLWPRSASEPKGFLVTGPAIFLQAFTAALDVVGAAEKHSAITRMGSGSLPNMWAQTDYAFTSVSKYFHIRTGTNVNLKSILRLEIRLLIPQLFRRGRSGSAEFGLVSMQVAPERQDIGFLSIVPVALNCRQRRLETARL